MYLHEEGNTLLKALPCSLCAEIPLQLIFCLISECFLRVGEMYAV